MIGYKTGIKWGYKNSKPGAGISVSISPSLKGERLYSFAILLLLLAITFFPLVAGKNFIPFERYPQWSSMLAESSGQLFRVDFPALKRFKFMPWAQDREGGSIGINWAENLYFAHNLRRGKLSLWDPYTGGGVPTLDSGQSRPFNPFRLPFYLFSASWVYSLTLVIGLLFGGIGAYLWLSRRGLSPTAVMLGTGLFILNPWVLDRLVLTDSAAYFVLPWCLLTLEQAVWGCWSSIGRAVLCFVLMGHSGHPVVCVIMAGAAGVVYLFGEKKRAISQENLSVRVKILGVVATLTSVCLTVLWLPLLKLISLGYIYKRHGWFHFDYSWKSLVVLPSDMFVVPAVIAVLTCAVLEWKRLPKIWLVLLTSAFLILIPMPWIGTLPSRFLSYSGLPTLYLKGVFWASISLLAAYGLEAYLTLKKSTAMIVFGVGTAMLAVSGWQFVSVPMSRDDISAFPVTAFFLLAFGLLGLVMLRTVRGRLFPLLMSAVILTPLAFPLSLNRLVWNTVDFKTNPVVEWLKTHRPHARAASIDPGLYFAIPPNLGQAYGIRCVEVNAAVFLNNYYSMFHHPKAFSTAVFFDFLSTDVLRQMGASVVLLSNQASPIGLELLFRGSQFSAYAIPETHGRLYFAERACHYKPGKNFPSQILSINQETDAVAVVEGMGNPLPPVIPEIPSGKWKTVFERDDTENVVIRTECPSEGLLVLRDSWYPGWMAFIDGERAPVLRINGCFRGVIVPEGAHKIKFVYRPILIYVAGTASLMALLVVAFVSVQKSLTGGNKQSISPCP
jgi:hypothetical protein